MTLTSQDLEAQLRKVHELECNPTFRLAILPKALDRQAGELLSDMPVKLTEYRVLRIVDVFGEISISDISRRSLLDRAQISRTAVTLERLGLVEFRSDSASRRKKLVALSQEGRALLNEIGPRFAACRRGLEEGLGPEGLEALWTGMRKLARILEM